MRSQMAECRECTLRVSNMLNLPLWHAIMRGVHERVGLCDSSSGQYELDFADNNVVTMGDMTIADLTESVPQGATVDSPSDTECSDDVCAPQPVTLVTTLTTLHMQPGSSKPARTIVHN